MAKKKSILNLKVYKINAQHGFVVFHVCTGFEHWKIEYESLEDKVASAKEIGKCDRTCQEKRCLGMHQFIRKTIEEGKEFNNLC